MDWKKNLSGVMYRRFILYSPSRSTRRVNSRIPVPRTFTSCTIPFNAASKTEFGEMHSAHIPFLPPVRFYKSGAWKDEWVGFSRAGFRGPGPQPGALGSKKARLVAWPGRPGLEELRAGLTELAGAVGLGARPSPLRAHTSRRPARRPFPAGSWRCGGGAGAVPGKKRGGARPAGVGGARRDLWRRARKAALPGGAGPGAARRGESQRRLVAR